MSTNRADTWSLLGDPSRRHIVEVLAASPHSVSELADALPISRPAVSQHLKVLKDAGLVSDEMRGTRRIYAVDAESLAQYRDQLDRFWTATLSNLGGLLDQEER